MLATHLGPPFMTVQRTWRKHVLQPHRLERRMVCNDPGFETKATDAIQPYLNPLTHAMGFCVDEKTAIHALDRKECLPPL